MTLPDTHPVVIAAFVHAVATYVWLAAAGVGVAKLTLSDPGSEPNARIGAPGAFSCTVAFTGPALADVAGRYSGVGAFAVTVT